MILKKRDGCKLSEAEIKYLVSGYTSGMIPDYQAAALTMAIFFQGMDEQETLHWTRAMVDSGDRICLEEIPGIKVDKHSTGGVGDTTTLVLLPLVAAAGVPVVKLSGRGLGHTGGTLDKLESIPGFRTEMTAAELTAAVKNIGVAVAGQSDNLVPADRKLYALRDVTATVDSIPLIAGSIMAKKLAAGADAMVLDVKCGRGAFMKDRDKAFELARIMVTIGRGADLNTVAVISGMDQPLGWAIGNALEVKEAILTLRGAGPPDLAELCLILGGWMFYLAGKVPGPEQGKELGRRMIKTGRALEKFRELITNQNGNALVIEDPSLLPGAAGQIEVKAGQAGFVGCLDAGVIGAAAAILGAGRDKKEASIDPAAGIILEKKTGDSVSRGEALATIHARPDLTPDLIDSAAGMIISAYRIVDKPVEAVPPLLYGWVDQKGDEHRV